MQEPIFKIHTSYKIGAGIAIIVVIGILTFYSVILSSGIECEYPERLITIPKGASPQEVAQLLKSESCLQNESVFRLALTMTMKNKKIIPGKNKIRLNEKINWDK